MTIPPQDPGSSETINALREHLQLLMRRLGRLENHQDEAGESITTSHAEALMVLLGFHVQGKKPTLSDMVEHLRIDKSNVTRLCQRMKTDGYIHIERDPDDRRAKRITLSSEGLELAEHVNAQSLTRFSTFLETFSEEERTNLLGCMGMLNTRLEEMFELTG